MVERARRIQAELDALAADVASVRDEVAGVGRIGLIGTTARWLVPALVETMAQRHPLVRVVVHDATTSALQLQLDSGTIDMAVLTLPVADTELVTEPLFDEDRLLIVPVGPPLLPATSGSPSPTSTASPSCSSRSVGRSGPSSRPCSTSGATSSCPRPRSTAPDS